MGILNLNACIAYTDKQSPFLNQASRNFHDSLGFELVGRFHQSGYKFEQWFDMIWMEKRIGKHTSPMNPPRQFGEIYDKAKDKS